MALLRGDPSPVTSPISKPHRFAAWGCALALLVAAFGLSSCSQCDCATEGAGGTGGTSDNHYVDDQGNCRSDAAFDDLGCPSTYAEALLMDRCGTGLCQGTCGYQHIVQDLCSPGLRCAYDAGTGQLSGVVVNAHAFVFCDGVAASVIYGEVCRNGELEAPGLVCPWDP